MGALQIGHLRPWAFSSSPHCIHAHMCPHRYRTELMLDSEQIIQWPELTTLLDSSSLGPVAAGDTKIQHLNVNYCQCRDSYIYYVV